MKGTETFKNIIGAHLQSVAEKDPLFADTLKKPNKNLDGCINYILNTVKASGCNGFADDEVFGMAIHYYDEDDIKPGKTVKCDVVVNHQAEAIKKSFASPLVYEKNKPSKKAKTEVPVVNQISLFS